MVRAGMGGREGVVRGVLEAERRRVEMRARKMIFIFWNRLAVEVRKGGRLGCRAV